MRISAQMLETYRKAYNDQGYSALKIHMRAIALKLYGTPLFNELFPSQQRQVVGNYIYKATILNTI